MSVTLVGTSSSTETGSVGTGTVPWSNVGTIAVSDVALYFWIFLTGSTATDPSGFTLQGTVNTTAGSGTIRFLTKVLTGSESGNASCSSTGADKVTAVMAVYRGVNSLAPVNAFTSLQGNTTGTSLPAPAATSTTGGVVAVTAFGSRVTTGPTSLTQSSPFTGEVTRAPYTGGGATAMALADNLTPYVASGTSVTPPNWTSNFSFATNNWADWTVLLAPMMPAVEPGSRLQAVNRAGTY